MSWGKDISFLCPQGLWMYWQQPMVTSFWTLACAHVPGLLKPQFPQPLLLQNLCHLYAPMSGIFTEKQGCWGFLGGQEPVLAADHLGTSALATAGFPGTSRPGGPGSEDGSLVSRSGAITVIMNNSFIQKVGHALDREGNLAASLVPQ